MKALIICLISGEYTLYDKDTKETFIAKPRGVFRNNKTSPKVGDVVDYTKGDPHAIITKVYNRHNDFIRPSVANIDQAFIVTSVKEPDINLNLLDRMITIFEFQDITPILIFSKIDLLNDSEKIDTFKIINYYKNIGYTTITTTKKIPLTIKDLKPYLKDKISVIAGQSGVGKSSILNIIDENINMDTNEISKALNRGKHTTRYTKLFNVYDGWIADSPGFGTMELDSMDEVSVSHSFIEFFNLSAKCKYNGCLHINEPHCNVKKSLEEKTILKSRYDNYLQFVNEIKNKRKW
jgi:ribosome biogenesis GTPase